MSKELFDRSGKMSTLYAKYINVDDMIGGTESMREAGEKYLFKEPKESDINYKLRLNRTTLFPAYARSIKNAVGKVFTKPLQVELPAELEEIRYDIDGTGQSLEAFAKEVTEEALHYGIAYIFVDYPVSRATTLEEERSMNNNPYFVSLKPLDVLEINTEWINNKLTLTYFRFYEEYYEDGKYRRQVKELILEGDQVLFNIYRKDERGMPQLVDSGFISGVDAIPIVPVYGKKIAPYHGTPALYDLYELNVSHWRAYSDFLNITHYSQVPMLMVKGMDASYDESGEKQDVVISSNTVFDVGADGDVKWIEVGGSAATVGLNLLKDLEDKMAVLGLQLFMNSTNHQTATESLLDAAEEQSMLKSITIDVESAINEAMLFAAIFKGVDTVDISITIDSSYTVVSNNDFTYIMDMHEAGMLTAEEVIQEAKRRNIFKPKED